LPECTWCAPRPASAPSVSGGVTRTSSRAGAAPSQVRQPVEDRREPLEVAVRPADGVETVLVERGAALGRLLAQGVAEGRAVAPGLHRRGLHERVGVLARHARVDELEQDRGGVDETARRLEVGLHALGVDGEAADQPGGEVQQVVGGDRGVRQCDAFDGGVRDVALVPQRDALGHRADVAAHDPGQPADALAQDRVALVRHRRGPLLPTAERLLQLAHLRALPVPHLQRDRLADGGDDRERADPLRDPVAQHDLRRDRGRRQPQGGRDLLLDRRIDVGVGAHRAGDLADRDRLAGPQQPVARARHPEREVGNPVAPGVGLGVHAVGAADPHRRTVRQAVVAQRCHELGGAADEQVGRLGELHAERRVEQVRRRHAVVDVSSRVARVGVVGPGGQERDDVVLGHRLDRGDRLGGGRRGGPHRRDRVGGHDARPGVRLEHQRLDPAPQLVLVRVAPDAAHLGQGVALDHLCT
jgi:hypothetical protein